MVFNQFQILLFTLLGALLLAYTLTPVFMWLGMKAGLVDVPGGRRQHEKPTPRSGGLAVFCAFFGAILLLQRSGLLSAGRMGELDWTREALGVCAFLMIVGILDDRFEVTPLVKLAGQLLVSALAWAIEFRIERMIGIHLHPLIDAGGTILIFVAAMNAYNLIDGMDGVAGGLGAVTGVGLCGLNLIMGNVEIAAASLALTGACLGFLRYNFHPAQVFLGDAGSMLIGFLLICLTLASNARSAAAVMLILPLLSMGVPMIDAGLAVWRRSLRKAYFSDVKVTQGDRDHLHHRLARRGLTQRRVAVVLYSLQAAAFLLGLLWLFGQNYRIAVFTIAFFAGAFVLFRYLATLEMTDSGRLIVDGIRRPGRTRLLSSLMPFIDVGLLLVGLVLLFLIAYPVVLHLTPARKLREAAPPIVAGPVILLWATRHYRPLWSRARAMDFFFFAVVATCGVLVGISISTLPQHHTLQETIILSILYLCLVLPAMSLCRVLPRLAQDMVHHFERKDHHTHADETHRVLIYGAGYGYSLLTRAESFDDTPRRRKYRLVGLMDDDPALRHLYLHGHRVLGGLEDLPRLVRERGVTEVIVTTSLRPENMRRLLRLASGLGVKVTQSILEHRVLVPKQAPARDGGRNLRRKES